MFRSTSLASLLALALVGCPSNPPRADAGGGTDAPVVLTDTPGSMTDTPAIGSDTPSGRVCRVGAMGCDVLAQDCTPDMGTARGCYLAGDGAGGVTTQCAPSGVTSEGGACTNVNDCAEGLTCQEGMCLRFCCMGATSDCDVGYRCIPFADPAGGTEPLVVGVCSPPASCTVIPNSGCPDGNACLPDMDGTLGCYRAGDAAEGETCGGTVGCQPGLGCFGPAGGPFSCIAFCLLSDPMCNAGFTCTAQPAVVGGGYGLCTPS